MAKAKGNALIIKKNGTTIAAVREKTFSFSGEGIDVTTDDDTSATVFLANEFASTTKSLEVSGLSDSPVLQDLAFSTSDSDKHLTDLTVHLPNGDIISGTFIMTSYTMTGSYNDAVTFSASFVRSGMHTLTAAP